MPKLLIVVSEDWYFVSHRIGLGAAAREAGFEVVVATRCREAAKEIVNAGLRTTNYEMSRRGTKPVGLLNEVGRLVSIYKKEKPDIVHHVALRPVVVGAIAAAVSRQGAVVAAIPGLGSLFSGDRSRSFVSRVLKFSLPIILRNSQVIVQTADDYGTITNCGMRAEQMHLIRGAGVNTSLFQPTPEPRGTPLVILPSRMLWDKGVQEFVRAARLLKSRGCAARFALVGEPDVGNPSAIPAHVLQEWEGEGAVECWGQRKDMANVLRQATLVCLPSKYREGVPKALIEALAAGRACIASDNSGCREVVRHGDNGLLIPVGDSYALADAIQSLLHDSEARARMGARGRERALTEFDEKIVIEQTLALYARMLAGK